MMIIKYFEWLRILPEEKHAIYELCKRDPKEEDGVKRIKTLTREVAKKMIEDNNLHIVQRNKYGIIWE